MCVLSTLLDTTISFQETQNDFSIGSGNIFKFSFQFQLFMVPNCSLIIQQTSIGTQEPPIVSQDVPVGSGAPALTTMPSSTLNIDEIHLK